MAVVHKATASAVGSNNATVTIPASVVEGDLLVAHTSNKNLAGSLVVPPGWMLIEEVDVALTLSIVYKIADSTDAGSDVLFGQESTSANAAAIIDVFTGHDPVFPIGAHASADVGAVTNPQTPSVDAEFPGLLLCGTAQEVAAQATTATPPLTLANDEPNSSYTITVTTGYDQVGVGATGSRGFTRGTSAKSKVSSVVIHELGPGIGYPIIAGMEITAGGNTEHPVVPLPPGSVAGDGLLILVKGIGSSVVNDWAGFTEMGLLDSGYSTMNVGYKSATGTEGDSVQLEMADSTWRKFIIFRFSADSIVDWNITPPEWSTTAAVSGSAPNSPGLTPSWGMAKTAWLTGAWGHTSSTDPQNPTPPPNYDCIDKKSLSQYPLCVAKRFIETPSEDPDRFSFADYGYFSVYTLGIAPGVSAGGFEGFGAVNI